MRRTTVKTLLSCILCIVLVAAIALTTSGCVEKPTSNGEEKTFTFVVTDKEGKETSFQITSDKATVGEALLDQGLIAGEDSATGLYVKEVNGIRADFEEDGTYWAFYIGADYATAGVDSTPIEEGATYAFKVES